MLRPGVRVDRARTVAGCSRSRAASARQGVVYLKRQPPMGRDSPRSNGSTRLANHLADRGVPAARPLGPDRPGRALVRAAGAGGRRRTPTPAPTPGSRSERSPTSRRPARMLARLHAAGCRLRADHAAARRPGSWCSSARSIGAPSRRRGRALARASSCRRLPRRPRSRTASTRRYSALFDRLRADSPTSSRSVRCTATGRPTTCSSRGDDVARHHRLPPGRLRPAAARPGGRGRA